MTSFNDLLNRVEKYFTLEEIRKAKKAKMKPTKSGWRRVSESRRSKSKTKTEPSNMNVVGP